MEKEETRELHFTVDKMVVVTAAKIQKLTELYGGQCITIWADAGNTSNIYIGNRDMTTTRSIVLAPGATMDVNMTTGYKRTEYIVLYVDAAVADDSIRFIKI